jgi:uncharacterized protein (TIGR03086 family)
MSEVSDRYRTIADAFTVRVEGVRPDQWDAQTPCSEWNARDLLDHVVGVHRMALAALAGTDPAPTSPDDDLVALWRAGSEAVRRAVSDPATAATLTSAGPFGEQPFEQIVGTLVCTDTLIHVWDLARATSQDERLDPTAVSRSMEFLAPMDEGMRRPGGFAAKITPRPGADDQTRLLNFCGRAC